MHYKEVKGILSSSNGMNLYRGCTHGCIYCDSRSVCYGFDHEFSDIEVKVNSLNLLEEKLKSKRKKCMIGTGAMTDPYIHLESELKYTRRALELIEKYGFGVAIQTKSTRILRDLDVLKAINDNSKCVVQMTLTTFDEDLCRILEPNVSTTKERFEALKIFRDNGIPTVVWLSPILPFINDTMENLLGIMDYCIRAGVYGVLCFGFGTTARDGSREYFYKKLDEHFPGIKDMYIKKYGKQYVITSDNNGELMKALRAICTENGIVCDTHTIFNYIREFEPKIEKDQMTLFD